MILALSLVAFFQTGPIVRTEFPTHPPTDISRTVHSEELLKYGVWVHLRVKF